MKSSDSIFYKAILNETYFSGFHYHKHQAGDRAKELKLWKGLLPEGTITYNEFPKGNIKKPSGLPIPKALIDKIPLLTKIKKDRYKQENLYTDSYNKDPWILIYHGMEKLSIMAIMPSKAILVEKKDEKDSMGRQTVNIDENFDSLKLSENNLLNPYSFSMDELHIWPTNIFIKKGRINDSLAIDIPEIFYSSPDRKTGSFRAKIENNDLDKHPDITRDYYHILFDKSGLLLYIRHTPAEHQNPAYPGYLIQSDWCHWTNLYKEKSLEGLLPKTDVWLKDNLNSES